MLDLFADAEPWQEPLAAGAVILLRSVKSKTVQ
ncbi:DNA oxidative demethylase AlkB, partial [Escherichia coli]